MHASDVTEAAPEVPLSSGKGPRVGMLWGFSRPSPPPAAGPSGLSEVTLRRFEKLHADFLEHEKFCETRERVMVQALRDLRLEMQVLTGNPATWQYDSDTDLLCFNLSQRQAGQVQVPRLVPERERLSGRVQIAAKDIGIQQQSGTSASEDDDSVTHRTGPFNEQQLSDGGGGELLAGSPSRKTLELALQAGSERHDLDDSWVRSLPAFTLHPEWANSNGMGEERTFHRGVRTRDDLGDLKHSSYTHDPEKVHPACWLLVNPSSTPRLMWEVIGIVALIWDMFVIPLQYSFDIREGVPLMLIGWSATIYWCMDIPASLFVAYYHKDGTIETRPRKVARHYIRTWLFPDIVLVSLDLLYRATVQLDAESPTTGMARLGKLAKVVRLLRALRLLRLAKLRQLLMLLQARIDSEWSTTLLHVTEYLVFIVALNHWLACAWYKIGIEASSPSWVDVFDEDNSIRSIQYKYFTSLHWSLTQFTPASINIQPNNTGERIFAVIVLMFALCIFSSFVSSITTSMTNLRNLSMQYEGQFWLLRKYLRGNGVSASLSARIQRYLTVKLDQMAQQTYAKKVLLLEHLSLPLHEELQFELFRASLREHPLLSILTVECPAILRKICFTALTSISLSVKDVLFHVGEASTNMYFVKRGRLAYVPRFGSEFHSVSVLRQRNYMSEPTLWTENWVHVGTAEATLDSDLVAVGGQKFRRVILAHPAEAAMIKEYGREFLGGVNGVLKEGRLTDVNLNLIILQESPSLKMFGARKEEGTIKSMASEGVKHLVTNKSQSQ